MYDEVTATSRSMSKVHRQQASIDQSTAEVEKGDIAISLPPINVGGLISTQSIFMSPTSFNNQVIHIHLSFAPRRTLTPLHPGW